MTTGGANGTALAVVACLNRGQCFLDLDECVTALEDVLSKPARLCHRLDSHQFDHRTSTITEADPCDIVSVE